MKEANWRGDCRCPPNQNSREIKKGERGGAVVGGTEEEAGEIFSSVLSPQEGESSGLFDGRLGLGLVCRSGGYGLWVSYFGAGSLASWAGGARFYRLLSCQP